MVRNRSTYRNSTFDIPSNRNLWLTLGQYDALVEYQEVASRYYLGTFDAKKESFDSFLSRTSIVTGVRLNNISLANFREKQIQGYLVFPNASFDDFITDFVDDVKFLIDPAFSLSKIDGSKFDKLVDALLQIGISPSIEKFKKELYDYYRLLRNDVAHSLNQNYEKEYKTLDKKAIAAFYIITAKPKAHAFKNEMCFPLTKTKCELKKHPNSKFECFFNDFNRTKTSLFLPFPSKLIQDNLVCVLELQE